jgi:RNA polymerase sigma-70 factor (ECF subfamily)
VNIVHPFRVFILVTGNLGCAKEIDVSRNPGALSGVPTGRMDEDDVRSLLRKGNYAQALERLLKLHETKVFRLALMFLRNPARAEEVTQDIFLKLWQALPAYDGRASPGTWLYAIARNTCLSASRSEAYRRTVPLDQTNEPSTPAAPSTDIELERCINRLPEIQKQVITLFYLEEKRVEDVARLLALPEGTVKSHLYRARLALAGMIKE